MRCTRWPIRYRLERIGVIPSNIVGVDLCHRAGVKHYCMFHHEPIYDDDMIHRVLTETIRYEEITREGEILQVSTAYDGLEIEV